MYPPYWHPHPPVQHHIEEMEGHIDLMEVVAYLRNSLAEESGKVKALQDTVLELKQRISALENQ